MGAEGGQAFHEEAAVLEEDEGIPVVADGEWKAVVDPKIVALVGGCGHQLGLGADLLVFLL